MGIQSENGKKSFKKKRELGDLCKSILIQRVPGNLLLVRMLNYLILIEEGTTDTLDPWGNSLASLVISRLMRNVKFNGRVTNLLEVNLAQLKSLTLLATFKSSLMMALPAT